MGRREAVRAGAVVTVGGVVALVVSFAVYYLVFLLFRALADREGSFGFVPVVRIGYGVVWIGLCLAAFRSRMNDMLKACVLAGALATFMIGLGVQAYERPVLVVLIVAALAASSAFLLYLGKKAWYHFYAVAIAVAAAIVYL